MLICSIVWLEGPSQCFLKAMKGEQNSFKRILECWILICCLLVTQSLRVFSVDIFRAKLWSKPYCWRMKSFLEEFTCSIFLKMLDVVDIFRAKLCSKPSREDERVYSHFERKYLHQIRMIRKTFWLLRFHFFIFQLQGFFKPSL